MMNSIEKFHLALNYVFLGSFIHYILDLKGTLKFSPAGVVLGDEQLPAAGGPLRRCVGAK